MTRGTGSCGRARPLVLPHGLGLWVGEVSKGHDSDEADNECSVYVGVLMDIGIPMDGFCPTVKIFSKLSAISIFS